MQRALIIAIAILLSVPVVAFSVGGSPVDPLVNHVEKKLDAPDVHAEIVRDTWGVPHIYADDAYSLFFANGYAQAQDRMAQIDILRHVARGELASLTGPSGLELDLVTRRELYTPEERVEALQALPPEWQDAFQAFADGVNHRIDEFIVDPTKMPVEYPALAEYPEHWQATDTVAIAQYLLDVFGRGSGGGEANNAKLLDTLRTTLGPATGNEAFGDLVWGIRTDTYTTIKTNDAPSNTSWQLRPEDIPHEFGADLSALDPAQLEATYAAMAYEPVDDAMDPIGKQMAERGFPFKMGSNAQLISPEFSANGNAMLYGGPQMAYFAPMVPYEVGLHGAGFDATGMGVAGAPGVIIGRTEHTSFTITSGSVDQVDLVVERLVDDAYHYEVDGEVLEMDCHTETHIVRPGPADNIPSADPAWRPAQPDIVEQEVCRTIHGPVLGRTADGAYAFASYRSYRGDEVDSGVLWLQIGTVTGIDDFQDHFESFRFTFNFNYADDQGNIMYMHLGAQPQRDDRLDPRLPMPGWDSSYDWKGFDMGSDLPWVRNPTSGYTVNWNNNPAKDFPTGDIREKWGKTHRVELMAEQLTAAIDAKGKLTMDDLRAINEHAATHEPYADDMYPLFHAAAVATGDPAVIADVESWAASGFDWYDRDGDGITDEDGFRLYELWRERLQRLVFDDETNGDFHEFVWDPPTAGDPHAADHGQQDVPDSVILDALNGETAHAWCDNVYTTVTETCDDQAAIAMFAALAAEPDYGDFPMRQIRFVPLGAEPAWTMPMQNKPSFQHFYDWGLPEGADRSRNVLPPGNSGHMNAIEFLMLQGERNGFGTGTPPHMKDQLQMYIDFEDKPLLWDRATLESGYVESVQVLDL